MSIYGNNHSRSLTIDPAYQGPTALAVRSKFIAVGCADGAVLVYDHFQTLRCTLRPTAKGGIGPGVPVTSLDVSESIDWVVVGHRDGRIALWDWQKQAVLTLVEGKHASGIVHCTFLDMPGPDPKTHIVLSADQDGLVNKHDFSKGFFTGLFGKISVATQVLVNGTVSGRVLALSALRSGGSAHPALEMGLVAMSTEDRDRVTQLGAHTCIAKLLPQPSIVRQAPCPQGVREGTVPYLTWLPSSQGDKGVPHDPCLAIAWGHTLQIVVVSIPNNDTNAAPVFSQVALFTAEWHFCGVQFLTRECMIVQTSEKELSVLELKPAATPEQPDARKVVQLPGMDSPVPLVYHGYYVNVYNEPQQSHHNSFFTSGHLLYMLGNPNPIRTVTRTVDLNPNRRGGSNMHHTSFGMAGSLAVARRQEGVVHRINPNPNRTVMHC